MAPTRKKTSGSNCTLADEAGGRSVGAAVGSRSLQGACSTSKIQPTPASSEQCIQYARIDDDGVLDDIIPQSVQNQFQKPPRPVSETLPIIQPDIKVCRKYLAGRCKDGDLCKCAHTDPAPKESPLLAQSHSSLDASGRPAKREESLTPRTPEVCRDFLHGKCRNHHCPRLHQPKSTNTTAKEHAKGADLNTPQTSEEKTSARSAHVLMHGAENIEVCRAFLKGRCSWGKGCRDLHLSRTVESTTPTGSANICNSPDTPQLLEPKDGVKKKHQATQSESLRSILDAPISLKNRSAPPAETPEVCRVFLKGFCSWGRGCRWLHERPGGPNVDAPLVPPITSASTDVPFRSSLDAQPRLSDPNTFGSINYLQNTSANQDNLPMKSREQRPPSNPDLAKSTAVCMMFMQNRCSLGTRCHRFHPSAKLAAGIHTASITTAIPSVLPNAPNVSNWDDFTVKLPVPVDKSGCKLIASGSRDSSTNATGAVGTSTVRLPRKEDVLSNLGRTSAIPRSSQQPEMCFQLSREAAVHQRVSSDQSSSEGEARSRVSSNSSFVSIGSSQTSISNSAGLEHTPSPGDFCLDFLQGKCQREKCKYSHIDPRRHISQDCPNDSQSISKASPAVHIHRDYPPHLRSPTIQSTNGCFFCVLGLCNGNHNIYRSEALRIPVDPSPRPLPQHSSAPADVTSTALRRTLRKAKVDTVTVTLLDTTAVTFGAGFAVRDVTTAFESQIVFLSNIPPSVPLYEIMAILNPFGAVTSLTDVSRHDSTAPISVKVRFATCDQATKAVAKLHGALVFNSKISARLEFKNTSKGTGDVNNTTVRVSWPLPGVTAFAGYATAALAKDVLSAVNTTTLHDCPLSATVYRGLPTIGAVNLRIQGLPPDAETKDVVKFGPTEGVMMGRVNYVSADEGIRGVREMLEDVGELVTFDVRPPPYKERMIRAWAHFMTPEAAVSACSLINGRRQRFLGGEMIWAHHVQYIFYSVLGEVFDVLADGIRGLHEAAWSFGGRTSIHVSDRRGPDASPMARVSVKLVGESVAALLRLKAIFEKMLRGEILRKDGNIVWDESFAYSSGSLYLNQLRSEHPGVLLKKDNLRRMITLFGSVEKRSAVVDSILAEVTRLQSLKIHFLPLEGRAIRIFMSPDLMELQQKFGPENIILDLGRRALKVRGGEQIVQVVEEVVRKEQARHPMRRSKPRVQCPVCFDEASVPVTLDCGHSWCKACLNSYLTSAMDNKSFPLTCLGNNDNCQQRVPLSISQEILSPSDFQALALASFLVYVHTRPKEFHYCPTTDCTQIYRTAPADEVLQCPSCLVRICPRCNVESHEGLPCQWREDDSSQLFDEWRDSHDVKACPGCKTHIEKSSGCNHMTCTRCQTHICWVCLETFSKGEGIYEHMRTMHGSIGI